MTKCWNNSSECDKRLSATMRTLTGKFYTENYNPKVVCIQIMMHKWNFKAPGIKENINFVKINAEHG